MDNQYQKLSPKLNERKHAYGEHVHLLSDPYLLTRLARLCSAACIQPEINDLVAEIYRGIGRDIANAEIPRTQLELPTRMAAQHPEAVYVGDALDRNTKIVFVDLARAGILPSSVLFQMYSAFLEPAKVRIDHIFINRTTDKEAKVTGAAIHGSKIGGSVQDALVIVPDPMGATGHSMANVIQHYKEHVDGTPKKWVSTNLIVTPEYIRHMKSTHPDLQIYALRLDRAFSSSRALAGLPGTYPEEESGLNHQHYIVPGGGGFGELMSNAFV